GARRDAPRAAPPPRPRCPGGARRWPAGSSCDALRSRPAGVALAQQPQDPLRIEGELPDADAARVVEGVGDGRNGRVQRAFAGFLGAVGPVGILALDDADRKSTRLNSSHVAISYAVFC